MLFRSGGDIGGGGGGGGGGGCCASGIYDAGTGSDCNWLGVVVEWKYGYSGCEDEVVVVVVVVVVAVVVVGDL